MHGYPSPPFYFIGPFFATPPISSSILALPLLPEPPPPATHAHPDGAPPASRMAPPHRGFPPASPPANLRHFCPGSLPATECRSFVRLLSTPLSHFSVCGGVVAHRGRPPTPLLIARLTRLTCLPSPCVLPCHAPACSRLPCPRLHLHVPALAVKLHTDTWPRGGKRHGDSLRQRVGPGGFVAPALRGHWATEQAAEVVPEGIWDGTSGLLAGFVCMFQKGGNTRKEVAQTKGAGQKGGARGRCTRRSGLADWPGSLSAVTRRQRLAWPRRIIHARLV